MSKLKEFTASTARPLPVIILADVSGSMSVDGKIETLDRAVSEMLDAFSEEDDSRAKIHVAVITFGGNEAKLHQPLQPASETQWKPLAASGRTPMGNAFEMASAMLEDRNQIPSRAYRPTLILVSDGIPTDEWKSPLQRLLTSERSSKADRFALGIGDDADKEMLQVFLDNSEKSVFEAHEARKIRDFFRWVTMSVTSRTRSTNPNSVIRFDPDELDDDF